MDRQDSETRQEWEDVGDEVVAAILEKLKPALKKASETIYEDLLYTAQDYLIDNVRWNIRSAIDAAKRQARHDREKVSAIVVQMETVRSYVDDVARGYLIANTGVDLRQTARDDIKVIDAAIEAARR
jgi:hypothetical protein